MSADTLAAGKRLAAPCCGVARTAFRRLLWRVAAPTFVVAEVIADADTDDSLDALTVVQWVTLGSMLRVSGGRPLPRAQVLRYWVVALTCTHSRGQLAEKIFASVPYMQQSYEARDFQRAIQLLITQVWPPSMVAVAYVTQRANFAPREMYVTRQTLFMHF
jgi:hypothetical protein